ncbi:hypothetical protein L226DRAFT_49291 [Lentinus tigrinus ALCF2SS1-7]|uniref:uncharacterized protein n=1 Tax=Lentinus tigrinus ALCF2SS1-7 TaxID=1328758 RepID=UPI00116615A9|nr:hypothetical protein L226DRAFT_49291 [Lentinus tigrinus ALCF2SS1-7]
MGDGRECRACASSGLGGASSAGPEARPLGGVCHFNIFWGLGSCLGAVCRTVVVSFFPFTLVNVVLGLVLRWLTVLCSRAIRSESVCNACD